MQAYQWWWEVSYLDKAPARNLTTANEIHVPVGRPVSVELAAADVIHSFWVPNLAGKQDLIPARDNRIAFTAGYGGVVTVVGADGTGRQALTADGYSPGLAWSPDGEWLLGRRATGGFPTA